MSGRRRESRELQPVMATKSPRSLFELSLDESERGEWPASDLPDGWRWVKFHDLFYDITDSRRKLPTKDYQKIGRFPIVDQGEALIAGYSDREEMAQTEAPPYIIFGDHTKCIKLIETRFVQGADGVKVLRAKAGFEIKFLRYALIAVRLPDKGYSRHMKFLRATVFPACSLSELLGAVGDRRRGVDRRAAQAGGGDLPARRSYRQRFSEFLEL